MPSLRTILRVIAKIALSASALLASKAGCDVPGFLSGAADAQFYFGFLNAETNSVLLADGAAGVVACELELPSEAPRDSDNNPPSDATGAAARGSPLAHLLSPALALGVAGRQRLYGAQANVFARLDRTAGCARSRL